MTETERVQQAVEAYLKLPESYPLVQAERVEYWPTVKSGTHIVCIQDRRVRHLGVLWDQPETK